MRFSLFTNIALVGLSGFGLAAAGGCDDGPFAAEMVGGVPFPAADDYQTRCDTRWEEGQVITGLEIWSAKFQVKAIKVRVGSTWSDVRGSIPEGDQWAHDKVEWSANDNVGVRLWGNRPDDGNPMDGVGRIQVYRGDDVLIDVGGAGDKTDGKELEADAGAGKILAMKVRAGAWVTSVKFLMLKSKVINTTIIDVKLVEDLDRWNKERRGLKRMTLDEIHYINPNPIGGNNLTFSFTTVNKQTISKTVASETTNQWASGVDVKIGVEVKIPFLGKTSVDVTTSFEYTRVETTSESNTVEDTVDLSVTLGTPGTSSFLAPQTAAHCQSMGLQGVFDSGYTGTIEAKLEDGTTYRYKDHGHVASVGWRKGSVSCLTIPLKDVPEHARIEEAAPVDKRAISFRG